jgi:hypothetical protein
MLEELELRFLPSVWLSIADPAPVQEGGGNHLLFVVSRSGDQAPLVVNFTTQDGTAKAGSDYQAESGTLSFAANQATATIDVPVLNDGAFQGQRTFAVLLSNPLFNGPFHSQRTLAVGDQPFAAEAADVNGDGKPDLAAANYLDGTVSVLLNTTPPGAAGPTFATQETFAVVHDPRSVATGDINGDGEPDLAVANTQDGTVSVLLNTTPHGATTPRFASQKTFAVGHGPQSVVLEDFNGDDKPDLAVANFNARTVSVLLNTTAPGATEAFFAAQETFAVGDQPFAVAVGDINGDGKPDLATANYLDGTVSVLLNTTPQGAAIPTFSAQQAFDAGVSPQSVAVKDMNGDGKPDLALANYGGQVSVLLNTTAQAAPVSAYAARQSFAVGRGASAVTAKDFDGDGKPDLAIANQLDDTISLLLNTTAQGAALPDFAVQQTFPVGDVPLSVAAADFDGDGKPDLAVANEGSRSVSVLLSTPDLITLDRAQAIGTLLTAPPTRTPTSTVLTIPPRVRLAGQPLRLTVQVRSTGSGTGRVEFLDRFHGVIQMLGVGALGPTGTASLTVRLAAGPHRIFAFYLGNVLHAPSFSSQQSFQVRRRHLSAPSARRFGRVPLNLAAAVRGPAGPATGQVLFLEMTGRPRILGTALLDGAGFARIRVRVRTGRLAVRAMYLGHLTSGSGESETVSFQWDVDRAAPGAVPLLVIGPSL